MLKGISLSVTQRKLLAIILLFFVASAIVMAMWNGPFRNALPSCTIETLSYTTSMGVTLGAAMLFQLPSLFNAVWDARWSASPVLELDAGFDDYDNRSSSDAGGGGRQFRI